MVRAPWRAMMLAALFVCSLTLLVTCGSMSGGGLYVQDVIEQAQNYTGQEITVDGAYVWRPGDPGLSVLALGVSTLDNGLDAQPLGDAIWVENFPAEVTSDLHRPGDSVYGFVRVTGTFETGGEYGPDGSYTHLLQVTQAQPIEQVKRVEHTIDDRTLEAGKVSFFELQNNPEQYHGQVVTTRGYYFWNSLIWVLSEGIATEEDGSSPQPMGTPIWMEGFPPDKSDELNQGPNNTYVWGLVEVTGRFETGGGYGKDGAYQSLLTVQSAETLGEQ
jgi:hypothetical protein